MISNGRIKKSLSYDPKLITNLSLMRSSYGQVKEETSRNFGLNGISHPINIKQFD